MSTDTKLSERYLELRELLVKGWCQRNYAMDDSGTEVLPESADATKWCLIGGILKITPSGYEADLMADVLQSQLNLDSGNHKYSLSIWNDDYRRKHLEIIELIERAALRSMPKKG